MTQLQKREQLNLLGPDAAALRKILSIANSVPASVYGPSDDSFLMIDVIARLPLNGKRVLDLGTGSGILALYCSMHGADVTASDVNEEAISEAGRTARILGVQMKLVVSDLFSNIQGRFDLILFNPPYLPSEGYGDRSVDGGPLGTTLIDRFLDRLSSHLNRNAETLLLLSTLNDPGSVQRRHGNFEFSTAATKRLFFEEIQVLRLRLGNDLAI
jgi:release factor glutamine methyltransferase